MFSLRPLHLVPLIVLSCVVLFSSDVQAQQFWARWKRQVPPNEWNPWRDPLERFDKHVFATMKAYGEWVKGFSIPMYLDDTYWDPHWSEYPQWFLRRINCFLGIPYAMAPVGDRRFQKAKPPSWRGTWDATYFRPACPQGLEKLQQDIPDFEKANISEDCLYMNIFVPNRTITQPTIQMDKTIYPVIVYLHSGDFSSGTAQSQPGHVLAIQDVVVVTFNYRLGALGYLSTEDENAPGNWGFSDQIQALDFIKRNIIAFRGDPNRITLMGDTAGAVSVGLHLVSPASRGKGYYHQVIMMSGTDLSLYGIVKPFYRPRTYAKKLAEALNCTTRDSYSLITCLRDNSTLPWEKFVRVQSQIQPNDGVRTDLSVVWAPTQDGGFYALKTDILLPEMPADLRRQNLFERVPAIIGINADDGAEIANRTVPGLNGGISTENFQKFLLNLTLDWQIIDVYRERAVEAIEFQYTFWPDPDNRTARGQEFIGLMTDLNFGIGMDKVVKQQSDYAPTYMYVFHWKSWTDWLPWYLGVSHSSVVGYVLGFPFLNESILNETYLVPRQGYDYDDRNISDFMMYMFSCFAKYGDPTPNITRNVTWQPFNQYNFTYLEINWHSYLWFRYRQSQYGFWNEYFPRMAKQNYFYATATPTPGAYEYVIATGCVSALLLLLLGTMAILIYLLWYQHQKIEEAHYRHDAPPRVTPFTVAKPPVSTSSASKPHLTAAQYASAQPSGSMQKGLDSVGQHGGSSQYGLASGGQYGGMQYGGLSPYSAASTAKYSDSASSISLSSKQHPIQHSVV